MAHSTSTWYENGETLVEEHPFRELIGNREDVYLTLRRYGMDGDTAYKAMTAACKGTLGRQEGLCQELAAAGIPGWYLESMKKTTYLFPKAHAARCCKIAYALAWFKVYDPEVFYQVTLKHTPTAPYAACTLPELEMLAKSMDPRDCSQSRAWETVCFLLEACQRGYCTRR